MRSFSDDAGRQWTATAREEVTPRHHGRWYLVFQPADEPRHELAVPEIRWQTRESAERTLRTMGEFELRRRLDGVRERLAPSPAKEPGAE